MVAPAGFVKQGKRFRPLGVQDKIVATCQGVARRRTELAFFCSPDDV
jgi:hypothetical protein